MNWEFAKLHFTVKWQEAEIFQGLKLENLQKSSIYPQKKETEFFLLTNLHKRKKYLLRKEYKNDRKRNADGILR